jgi:hypothetical protein
MNRMSDLMLLWNCWKVVLDLETHRHALEVDALVQSRTVPPNSRE